MIHFRRKNKDSGHLTFMQIGSIKFCISKNGVDVAKKAKRYDLKLPRQCHVTVFHLQKKLDPAFYFCVNIAIIFGNLSDIN